MHTQDNAYDNLTSTFASESGDMHAWDRAASVVHSFSATDSSSIFVASFCCTVFVAVSAVGEGVEMEDKFKRDELPVFEVRPEVIDSVDIDFESVTPDDAPAIWTEFK